jgi:hypothetical protein
MIDFDIFSAPADEANAGTIWQQEHKPRTVVTISRMTDNGKLKVFCVVRQFDVNFLTDYNKCACSEANAASHQPRQRWKIGLEQGRPSAPTLVMNQWYRKSCLGIPDLREKHHPASRKIRLEIEEAKWRWWRPGTWFPRIRAACHQPDLVVVLSTRLGVLGGWLGLVGFLLALIALAHPYWEKEQIGGIPVELVVIGFTAIMAFLAAIIGFSICRRPKRA